jgi:hypothetical protein
VAQYADACNLFDIPDGGQTLRHKLEVLDSHCRELGRAPETVHRTLSTRQGPGQPVQEFIDHCRDVADLGIDQVILHSGPAWTPEAIRATGTVVDSLA